MPLISAHWSLRQEDYHELQVTFLERHIIGIMSMLVWRVVNGKQSKTQGGGSIAQDGQVRVGRQEAGQFSFLSRGASPL